MDYDFSELDELQPSFAMTVHRAQGSEFPAVVVPVLDATLPDAAAKPAVHGDHQGEEAGGGCREPAGFGHGGAQRPSWRAQLDAQGPAFGDGDMKRGELFTFSQIPRRYLCNGQYLGNE